MAEINAQELPKTQQNAEIVDKENLPINDKDVDLSAIDAYEKQQQNQLDKENLPVNDSDIDLSAIDEYDRQQALQQKYGTTEQMAKTFAEAAARGAAGPLATLGERAAGIARPEDILAREEANPITNVAGTVTGLIGSHLAGIGLGSDLARLGKAAEAGAKTLGISSKIGSAAVAGAIEQAAFQTQDEITKLVLSDPNQSAESALANIGLATAIGGGVGAAVPGIISPLWKATQSSKTGNLLGAIAKRIGGSDVAPSAINDAVDKAGLGDAVTSEQRAVLENPELLNSYNAMRRSAVSGAGKEAEENFQNLRNKAAEVIGLSLDKTPEDVEKLSGLEGGVSKAEHGQKIGNILADEYAQQIEPTAKAIDELRSKFKDVQIPRDSIPIGDDAPAIPSLATEIDNKISQLALDQGWATMPSSSTMNLLRTVQKELPLQKNLKNLSDYISQLGKQVYKRQGFALADPELANAGGKIIKILRDGESELIRSQLGEAEKPIYDQLMQNFSEQARVKDAIDSRLSAKGSVSGYAKSIREMARTDSETLLNRLSGKNDADWLKLASERFPQTAKAIKDYHADQILSAGIAKAKDGNPVNPEAMLKYIQTKMSPELREFVVPNQSMEQIKAVNTLLTTLNKVSPDSEASLLNKVARLPGSAMGLISGILSHSPVVGGVVGALGKSIGVDAPEAIKLALLKWLGSGKPINPVAFKAMAENINSTIKAESLMNRGVKSVFKARLELPAHLAPVNVKVQNLDKTLKLVAQNPNILQNNKDNNDLAYYMPDHAMATGRVVAAAYNYLNAQRPNTQTVSPLDTKQEPTPAQKEAYNRILTIATSPLSILHHIKNGTIIPKDVETIRMVSPNLYNRLVTKLSTELSNAVHDGDQIPYNTKLGLSIFLGQPLDTTMTPKSITTIQQMAPGATQQPAMTPQPQQKGRPSSPALNKVAKPYQTPGQAAEMRRSVRD